MSSLLMQLSLASASSPPIAISIDVNPKEPAKSGGVVHTQTGSRTFGVGFGKRGLLCEGSRFKDGYTLLGRFQVNAILSADRFEMMPGLIQQSGRSETYLRAHLFENMNSIDFNSDGRTQEYGSAFIGLQPRSATEQPFGFNEYRGKFRFYSFAIHGTNDEARVGGQVTGGCINVSSKDLEVLLKTIRLGDEVEVTAKNSHDLAVCRGKQDNS